MAVYTIGPSRTERHSHTWHRVTRKEPCPICSDIDWCEVCLDGCVHCMRTESNIKSDSRMGGYIHNLPSSAHTPVRTMHKPATESVTPAPLANISDRHRIYSDLLASCQLGAVHEAWLLGQGIDQPAGSYATLNGNRAEVCRHLLKTYPQELLITVPGLWIHDDGTLGIAAMDGLLVAVRGIDGRIERLQCRVEKDGKKAYHWLSSSSHGGPSSGAIAHYAAAADRRWLWITEGVKKADVAALLNGQPCVGMPSHTAYSAGMKLVDESGTAGVIIALDEDSAMETRELVDRSRQELVRQCLARGLAVRVARWDGSLGKGIDDLLMAGYQPTITIANEPSVLTNRQNGPSQREQDLIAILASPIAEDQKLALMALRVVEQDSPGVLQKRSLDPIVEAAGVQYLKSGKNKIGKSLNDASKQGVVKRSYHYDSQLQRSTLELASNVPALPAQGSILIPSTRKQKDAAAKRKCTSCGSTDLVCLCMACGNLETLEAGGVLTVPECFNESAKHSPADTRIPSPMDQQEDVPTCAHTAESAHEYIVPLVIGHENPVVDRWLAYGDESAF